MRTDVKLGIAISMALVLVVGGYFLFRSDPGEDARIAKADQTAASTADKQTAAPAPTQPRNLRPDGARPGNNSQPRVANRRTTPSTNDASRVAEGTPSRSPVTAPTNMPKPTTPAATTPSLTSPGQPDVTAGSEWTATPGNSASPMPSAGSPADAASRPVGPATPARTDALVDRMMSGGNTPTVASNSANTPDPGSRASERSPAGATPSKGPGGSMEVHRAQPGDTLVSLAQAYYGSAAYLPLLRDANPQVTDPTRVPAGTAIKIPPVPAGWQATQGPAASLGSKTPSNPPAAASTASGDKRTYTVRAGDSFYRIAEQQLGNANRWKELLTLNNKLVNGDPTRLRPGQVVVLPGS